MAHSEMAFDGYLLLCNRTAALSSCLPGKREAGEREEGEWEEGEWEEGEWGQQGRRGSFVAIVSSEAGLSLLPSC